MDDEFKKTVFEKFEKHDKRITKNEIALTSHMDVAKVIEQNQREDQYEIKRGLKDLENSIKDAEYVKKQDLKDEISGFKKDVKTSIDGMSEEVKKTITFKQLISVATVFIVLMGLMLSAIQWKWDNPREPIRKIRPYDKNSPNR